MQLSFQSRTPKCARVMYNALMQPKAKTARDVVKKLKPTPPPVLRPANESAPIISNFSHFSGNSSIPTK